MAEGIATDKHHAKAEEHNLTVALRVRPMNEDEIIYGATPIIHKVDKQMVVVQDPAEDPDDILRAHRTREKHFMFDIAFDGSSTQREVYEKTCSFLIPNVINGFNATVFAYGATGAGKTYTMLGTDDDPGIMGLALNELFQEMAYTREDMAYKVTLSYLEIYNEMIRDLLNPTSGVLDLREDAKGVQVAGLSEVVAKTTNEVMDILMQGNKERTQEPTAANKTSSRSHAVLQICVRQRSRVHGLTQQVRLGRLFLIDLAGSERAANTQNKGKRMVEGAHINRSLLALGNCINALSDRSSGPRYINYRDSKLTRILKDALGGNCKTVMIAHVSPSSIHFEESRNTLLYADRAKQIKTKVRRNVLDVSYHIQQYTNIIAELREEINRLKHKLDFSSMAANNTAALKAIKDEVINSGKQDQDHLNALKEQLMSIFKDQMELRRSVMELNNTAMEISLETTRNQLLIKRWQREKDLSLHRKEEEGQDPKQFQVEEKQRELAGSDEAPEPAEVKAAKEDLQSLDKERERTDKMKKKMQKELEQAKARAAKIEEMLPQQVNSHDQQEVLSLLCKVHELEIENMGMQSSCLLRNFELRKREMIIAQYEQHRSLCDEIILQQRGLIDDNHIACQKELEDLYEVYQQDVGEMYMDRQFTLPEIHTYKTPSGSNISKKLLEGESMTDFDRLSVVDEESSRHHLPKLFTPTMSRKQLLRKSSYTLAKHEKLSPTHSHHSGELEYPDQSHSHLHHTKSSSTLSPTPPHQAHQKSVLTMYSSRSDTSSPPLLPPLEKKPPTVIVGDRLKILKSTRNIAALAARRRTRAHPESTMISESKPSMNDGTLNRTYTSMQISDKRTESEIGLTESRLAQHDKKYASSMNLHRGLEMDDSSSTPTTERRSLATGLHTNRVQHGRALYRNTLKKTTGSSHRQAAVTPVKSVSGPRRKTRNDNYAAYQQLSKGSPRKAGHVAPDTPHRAVHKTSRSHVPHHQPSRSRAPPATTDVTYGSTRDGYDRLETHHTPQTVYQSAPERGKGLTVLKKGKGGPLNTSSESNSTPQPRQKTKGKRAMPTVPNYRKGDISVTGFSLQR